jgi:putative ABC transport system permease protein
VRVTGDPATAVAAIRRTLHAVAPNIAVTSIDPIDALIRRSFVEERFRTMLIDLFGVMAAVLATVGMYGVTARAVSRRTREVGIRVALGASAASVVRMIVTNTLSGVAAGVAFGVAVSLVASRVLVPYLFGVSPNDPATYAGIFALLALVSVVASWIPARRAGRVQPAAVLRE